MVEKEKEKNKEQEIIHVWLARAEKGIVVQFLYICTEQHKKVTSTPLKT